ncbi:MAG TPA: hypothetical protein VFF65_00700 [Phycisphaerales bacterium]|nr:hypothetical protein [Phycisphaerales bacterium]
MSIARKGRRIDFGGGRSVWTMPLLARDQEALMVEATGRNGAVSEVRLMNLAVCAGVTSHESLKVDQVDAVSGEVVKADFPAEPVMERSPSLGRKVMPRLLLEALSLSERAEVFTAVWHMGLPEGDEGKSNASPDA